MESRRETLHMDRAERWPALPYEAWRETCQTLHMWTQIVGKVRCWSFSSAPTKRGPRLGSGIARHWKGG